MTLWLTRIVPDLHSREARRDLQGVNAAMGLHRRLMTLYPNNAGPDPRAQFGVLFRLEDTSDGQHILLQSSHEPDLARLPDGYGTALTRPLDPLLEALRTGLTVRYRCTASPVRKPDATTRARYNLPAAVPLVGDDADEWWTRQADNAGLKPLSNHSHTLEAARAVRTPNGTNDKQHIRHKRIRFDGTATITNPDLLRQKITEGIGRGKAYGCGLLSIAPARNAP
ncbi:type I-E CRISPR-associated protein Cas6/Cse3/CasE [Streptomyces sp. NPDC005483]|uniref:type I-E CRISPR-associated protein Cas6/Cse3/CasE n=1 Tax=Streptomyces sp. NPDC005483 TaxID=3154882 RepID=UPI0033BA1911